MKNSACIRVRVGGATILAGILAFAVAGCGDDGDGHGSTPTATVSATAIATASSTATATATATTVATASATRPPSPTATYTATATPSDSPSATPTATITPSLTPTATPTTFTLAKVNDSPPSAPAGGELEESLTVRVADGSGGGIPDVQVEFAVPIGGGTVEPQTIRTAPDGTASARWTLGVVPVANRLRARVGEQTVRFNTRATLDAPYVPQPFADVNQFMNDQGLTGSTEDLAFESGRVLLGIPGGLLQVDPDGATSKIALSGDALVGPLGVAFDQQGNLWIADSSGHALRKMSPDGTVTTPLTSDGTQDLVGPNFIAIDLTGRVYLSDPCLGELLRFDPAAGRVDAVLTFDLPTEGGPNGFAFDATGEHLYVATENTALFCLSPGVGLTDEIAGLFSVAVGDSGFGDRQAVATNFALFGDGVTFDGDGNLYAIFDTQENLMLKESAVWVLPAGDAELVKFLAVHDHVLANVAFGRGDFGNTNLYISLLAVPPFTSPEARGLERFATGIRGLRIPPLPPSP